MPPVKVDPAQVKTFENAIAFSRWLSVHHHEEDEVWIRIYKVGSGLKSITPKEAIDVCLCWGWIDAVRNHLRKRSLPFVKSHGMRAAAARRLSLDGLYRRFSPIA